MIQYIRHIRALSCYRRRVFDDQKEKDSKGRILKNRRESTQKTVFICTAILIFAASRKTIYSNDLKELREREALIQRDSFDGIDYDAGSISAIKLIEQTLSLKVGLCETTIENYQKRL